MLDHVDAEIPALPASTVILARDGAEELEVFMIHRGADTAFGGMWAFPGGVVEESDIPSDTEPDPIPAARRAAARETMEEVGLEIDEDSLVWWSHWLPPLVAPRRFSTWFFLARADESHGDDRVGVDGNEVSEHRWIAPADALAAQAAGDLLLAPPTFVTLEQLYRYGDVSAAMSAASQMKFATEIAYDLNGARLCLFDGDADYGADTQDAHGPRHRLVMDNEAGWRYLNTAV